MELECKGQKKGRGFIILPLSVIRDGWLEENNDKSGKKGYIREERKNKNKKKQDQLRLQALSCRATGITEWHIYHKMVRK